MSSNSRASLLANLRTGGVRSASNAIPHSAAPTVNTFQLQDLPAVNGSFQPMFHPQAHAQAQAQVFQMQMMQMEILRLQALQQAQQAQQFQAEIARQQQQNAPRRTSLMEPATAGPTVSAFPRPRPSQADLLKSQLRLSSQTAADDHVPHTAALGGKFGGRLNPNATSFRFGATLDGSEAAKGTVAPANTPATANYTTVISGGTPLGLANGAPPSSAVPSSNSNPGMTPSKSDTVMNWRRGSTNNSVLSGNRAASVSLRVSPPPEERDRVSPPPVVQSATKAHRPQPLRFSMALSQPLPAVSIDTSAEGDVNDETDDTASSSSTRSDSNPTTPRSSSSSGSAGGPPLTPREEASKRLYEGLGLGRPAPQSAAPQTHVFNQVASVQLPHTSAGGSFPMRVFSQPMRQPRGPPSGADELGPKNFATRIRRQAIGGLGAMLDARVGRQIEAF